MNLVNTKIIALALSLYVANVGSAVFAQDGSASKDQGGDVPPPPPPDDDGFKGPMQHMFKKLGLSDDQKTKMDAIREAMKPKFKDLMQQLGKEREELGQEVADQVGVDKARAQHKKIQAIADQLADQRFEMMYQIAAVLTADQRKQLHDMEKEMMKKGPHHHHHQDE